MAITPTPATPIPPRTTPFVEMSMDEFNEKRRFWTVVMLALMAATSLVLAGLIVDHLPHPSVSTFFLVWSLFLCCMLGIFFGYGIVMVSVDPPTKAMPVFRQKAVLHLLPPGYYFLPLRSDFFFTLVLMSGQEFRLDVKVVIRTPDSCKVEIPFFLYFFIDELNPRQYIIAGKLEAIKEKLKDQIEEILREWITSPSKGPQTWMEARQAQEETVNAVLEILFDRDLARVNPISSEIPTEILFKWLDPQRKLTKIEEETWKPKIDALFSNADTKRRIEESVAKRHKLIERVKNGDLTEFRLVVAGMGIVISRLGLSNIEPAEETAKGVDEAVEATFARKKVEQQTGALNDAVVKVKETLGDGKEARKAVSVLLGFTKEEIKEQQFSFSPDMTQAMKEIGFAAIDKLSKGGSK